MRGPVLQILDMSYDFLNSFKDLKMQVLLSYFVRKAKSYYNAQLLDYWRGKKQKASLLAQVVINSTLLSYLRIFHSLSITTLNTSIC